MGVGVNAPSARAPPVFASTANPLASSATYKRLPSLEVANPPGTCVEAAPAKVARFAMLPSALTVKDVMVLVAELL